MITIRTMQIVWTEYHYSVFVFSPFSKPEYILYSVFGVFSDPEYIRYLVKNKYLAQHWFKAPRAWCAFALEQKFWVIGPLKAELWPCKEGNHQIISSKFEHFGQISSFHVQTLITYNLNRI